MRIDLPGIEAFLGVAHLGSFRRAAAHMNLSQAALSHRIKKLEESLGTALLARTTRRVTMTEAGLELLPVAQRAVGDIEGALVGLRDRGSGGPERLAVGCLPTIALLHLPAALAEFGRLRPAVRVQVYDNSADEIVRRVRAGEADFGITATSVRGLDLDIVPLTQDPFVLVCPTGHTLATRASVQWQELEGEALIRISAEEALNRKRETMLWRFEVQRVPTAMGMVRAGLGLTVLPRSGLDAHRMEGLAGVALRNPSVARRLGIVSLRDKPLPPHAAFLARLVTDRLKARPLRA
jgi:DNA-binding transcriptional LysR family regulator